LLVFAGVDPSGGAGMQADIEAIAALGAHALPVVTLLTVQDNDRVHEIHPLSAALVRAQALALMVKIDISAVKIGAMGSIENARAIAELIGELRQRNPALPVVLDPVLASGHGDALAGGNATANIEALRAVASLITPNLPEAVALTGAADLQSHDLQSQMQALLAFAPHVLLKGGHGEGAFVENHWRHATSTRSWRWIRLAGAFHGSGCTLASAIAALLAHGKSMAEALDGAQEFCHAALEHSFAIADGQRIPNRTSLWTKETS
jgi:hydroxymethylpyrimidine/phosphomethylpyrimidine kinase